MAQQGALQSPLGQVVLIGAVCFCCPGMFSALTGMGGGGQLDPQAANAALTALYSTFAVFGLLGGGINNLLGPRITVLIGSIFYSLYSLSFLHYNHFHNEEIVVAAGGLLGFGAGLLWAGQGSILMAYPSDLGSKGFYISVFWSVFNMGGVVGGLIPFVLNFRDESSTSVNDSTYVTFAVIMLLGSVLALGLIHRVPEGEPGELDPIMPPAPRTSVWIEAGEILKLFLDVRMLAFVPACIASNFFYTYQFNNVNGVLFNVRTRGLNNVVYWAAQMLGSVLAGKILDKGRAGRVSRGFLGIGIVAGVSVVVWGGAFANQRDYSRDRLPEVLLDFTDGAGFWWPFLLYSCFGLLDAMYQTLCYWIMAETGAGARDLSRYGGFYKGIQSAGAALAWQLDARRMPFMAQLWLNWGLMTLSFPLLWFIVGSFNKTNNNAKL